LSIRGYRAAAILACLVATSPASAASLVTVVNHSFEGGPVIADGQRISRGGGDIPGWKAASTVATGRANLSAAQMPSQATDGTYVGYLAGQGPPDQQSPNRLSNDYAQTLGVTLEANTRYTFTVDIGDALDQQFAGYNIGFVAGDMESTSQNTLLAQLIGTDSIDGGWMTRTISFETTDSTTGLGRPLSIYLRSAQGDFRSHFTYFDNVRVTSTAIAAVPEPESWALMLLGFGAIGAAVRRRGATSAVPA
jgi:hypothetical protein